MTVTFHTATLADKPTVDALVKACGKFVSTYRDIRNLDAMYRKGQVHVAEKGAALVGFAVAPHLVRSPWTSIYEIGVHPGWQRQGIGRDFVHYLHAVSPHSRLLSLIHI